MSPPSKKKKKSIFFKTDLTIFYYISPIYGYYLSKQICIGGIFRKITVRPLEAQRRNVDFVESGFTGQKGFC
jgi:hypothetical protein